MSNERAHLMFNERRWRVRHRARHVVRWSVTPARTKKTFLGFNDQMSFASLEHTGCDARVCKQVA